MTGKAGDIVCAVCVGVPPRPRSAAQQAGLGGHVPREGGSLEGGAREGGSRVRSAIKSRSVIVGGRRPKPSSPSRDKRGAGVGEGDDVREGAEEGIGEW